jgi:LacI family transcriptional regulator
MRTETRGRVTLQTIADATGLSKFAVSRSLSGKDGVSADTRERVERMAAELGYLKPQMQQERRDIIAVFHDRDRVNSELRMQEQTGVQEEARRLSYPLRLQWTHNPSQVAEWARGSAGLLLVGPHDQSTIDAVMAVGAPVVRMGWVSPLEQVDQVSGTDHEAGSAVGNYLIGLGHRTIAFVHGTPGYRGRMERYYGLREVTEQRAGVSVHQMSFEENSGFVPALRALHEQGIRPTAFFCAHDGLGVTVVSELLALGLKIPEDASVVGFGDFSAATQISPPLTTVRMNGAEIGAVALQLLIERINERGETPGLPRRVQVASQLIERRSSGPARAAAAPPIRRRSPDRRR